MADISQLGSLNASEPLDMAIYKDTQERKGFQLPKKGRYSFRAPESFPTEAFGKTQAGFLSAQVDPTIVGPSNEGYRVRFTKVSAKTFKRGGVTVSQVGDYLRAFGRRVNVGGNPQELADAVEQTANLTFEAEGDWRVYEKGTGWVLEGMENFPSDGNGGYIPVVDSPTQTDENGNPTKLRANFVITRYVPQS
jgi:hypothetical protein